jgi:uncharacterized membrane protein
MVSAYPDGTANSRELKIVGGLSCLFAGAYAAYALFRHWHFESSYDLGIFDQLVWHVSRFDGPASSLRGYTNMLGDHFSPIVALFAPLYWIVPSAETLLVAQAVLLAASIVPVYAYARARLPASAALLLSIAYGLFWGLQQAAGYDVHEVAFAPPVMAGLILAMDRGRWRWFWIAAAVMMLIKEELIGVLVFVGAFLIVRGERRRGSILLISSAAVFMTVVGVIIPAAGAGVFEYRSAFAEAIDHPWRIPTMLVTPGTKIMTAFLWIAPFALLPLFSPLVVWLAPFACIRFLSTSPNHWGTIFHYSAPLAPVVAMAAADGLGRIIRRIGEPVARARTVATSAGVTVVLSSILPGHQPLWRLLSPNMYITSAVHRSGQAALALVPPDASVVAQAAIASHLTHRDEIYVLDRQAREAEYVIAATHLSPWPAASEHEIKTLVSERRRRGYALLFEQDGWILLRRKSP